MRAERALMNGGRDRTVFWLPRAPVCERRWGGLGEDDSESDNLWSCLSHDQARPPAHSWGENRLAGIPEYKLGLFSGRPPSGRHLSRRAEDSALSSPDL